MATALIGCTAAALLAAGVVWFAMQPTGAVRRLSIILPTERPLALGWNPGRSLAISPDGTRIAYVGQDRDARTGRAFRQLFVRSLDSLVVTALPGTEVSSQPFFSPDGEWVAFFTDDGQIRKVSLAGGRPVTLLEKLNGAQFTFGAWTDDGTIVFGGLSTEGLQRIPEDGGVPQKLTTLETSRRELQHEQPEIVAGSGAVLFQVEFTGLLDPRIEAVLLESGERRVVVENASGPRYLPSGHLLFRRDDVLLVAPFDASRLALTGSAVPLIDDILRDRSTAGELAVSDNGTMAYVPASDPGAQALGIVNRRGEFQPLGPPPNRVRVPRVSGDGQYVAFEVRRPGQDAEVHIHDVTRGATTKLTLEGSSAAPAWRARSRELSLTSTRSTDRGMYLADLSGRERLLISEPTAILRNGSWSPDGNLLAYTVQNGSQHDIWVLTMGDQPSARPLLTGPPAEFGPKFLPDGRWLAYVSDESGRREVYVRQFPDGEKLAVSTGGGQSPVWAPDGREIFFTTTPVEGPPRLMVVEVTRDASALRLGEPRPLFNLRFAGPTGIVEQYLVGTNVGAEYDIFPDGQRFVMVRGLDPRGTREIVVVQDFLEDVRRLAPIEK